ncbi:MAG: 4Fe-4S binding protein [Deltaproteobacteria bacterium]|nr:4Fe-4S binding protein [Deltaproteobacteria bacterium]
MASEVYFKLRERLDEYSIGFPSSPSGVEIEILERLFTPEEAELFLHMSLMIETSGVIAERSGQDSAYVTAMAEQMAAKGTVFRLRRDGVDRYAAVPFVLGIYEFQAGSITRPMAELYFKYFEEALIDRISEHEQLLRPIPVNRAIDVGMFVATYEDSREIVKKQKLIAVTHCLCREEKHLLGHGCDKPLEVCMAFGAGAQHFIDMGRARPISVEEALKILDLAEESGLVTQPANSQNPGAICNCCRDCCVQLRTLNRMERPAEVVVSNFFAVVEAELCSGCGICEDRCPMRAVEIRDGIAAMINLDRCIGCGLCVTTCPTGSLHLQKKSKDRWVEPPHSAREQLINIAAKRGKSIMPKG